MPVVGRTPAHGVPGPPGGWATGKLTGAAGGWELIGLKPGALTGNRGGTGGALGRGTEPDCIMFGGAMDGARRGLMMFFFFFFLRKFLFYFVYSSIVGL